MMKLSFKKAEPFWSTLSENSCLSAACAGNQTCGKCRITLVQGTMPITDTEKRLLSKEEIKAGIRLACCHEKAEEDIAISINQETDFAFWVLCKNKYLRIKHKRASALRLI